MNLRDVVCLLAGQVELGVVCMEVRIKKRVNEHCTAVVRRLLRNAVRNRTSTKRQSRSVSSEDYPVSYYIIGCFV